MSKEVWLVWTESGDYEQWSRDLAGIFGDRAAARAHADALEAHRDSLDKVEIKREVVLTEPPTPVTYHRWSAHITPEGNEDPGLGYNREAHDGWYWCWSNSMRPARGKIVRWSGQQRSNDLYVEVTGYDLEAVRAKYARLLEKARRRLALAVKE